MLKELSKEQIELMHQHRNEYIDFIVNNGKHCPDNLKESDVREDIEWIYKKAGLKSKPTRIIIAPNFLQEKLIINHILDVFGNKSVQKKVYDTVKAKVPKLIERRILELKNKN